MTPINPNYEVLKYDEGFKDGKLFESNTTYDQLTGKKIPVNIFNPRTFENEELKKQIFEEQGNNASYIAGFNAGQEDFRKLSDLEKIDIVSNRKR